MQNYRAREKNKWKGKWAGQSAGDWGRVRDSVDYWHTWIQRSLPSVPEEVQSASLFSSLTGCKRVKSEHIVPEPKIIRTSAVATISSLCPSSWQPPSCALKRKDLLDTHLLGGCDSEMDHVLHFKHLIPTFNGMGINSIREGRRHWRLLEFLKIFFYCRNILCRAGIAYYLQWNSAKSVSFIQLTSLQLTSPLSSKTLPSGSGDIEKA